MTYDSAATAQAFPRGYGWRHLAPSAANALPAWYAPASVPKAPYYSNSCGDHPYYPQPQQPAIMYHQAYNPYTAPGAADPRVPSAYYPNRSVALPHPRQAQQQQRSFQSEYYAVPQQPDVWDCALSSARRSYEGAQMKKPAVYGAPYLTPPHSGELSARMVGGRLSFSLILFLKPDLMLSVSCASPSTLPTWTPMALLLATSLQAPSSSRTRPRSRAAQSLPPALLLKSLCSWTAHAMCLTVSS